MLKKLLTLLLALLLFLSFPKSSYAQESFTTAYNVTYSVSETGNTHVAMQITLTNTTSDYYASAYSIQVGFPNISNVGAVEEKEVLSPKIKKVIGGNLIDVALQSRVVGEGKKQIFTISFDTPDIANKQGSIWEVNIPGISNQEDFKDFTVSVNVPPSFGKPTYSKPKITGSKTVFTGQQLGKSGISISYGDRQIYDFTLYYHLKNKNLFPIQTEVALPPTTNYQDVFIEDITPRPLNVAKDADGNWMAKYRLSPSEKMDIVVVGKAQLYLTPRSESVSESDLAGYLKEQPHWQVSDPEIKQLARELKTPETIYNYVVKTLTYDFERVTDRKTRLGAKGTLINPSSAVCLEFTDLFVAIARASGIPAREVNGFAYTQNSRQRPLSLVKDILHAWPEYYDREKKRWIMVDPTWGNTTGGVDYFMTLDFDHFAFVIKGIDSEYPVPAGGYKLIGEEDRKDVHIAFSDKSLASDQRISIQPEVANSYIPGLPITGKIIIRNVGQTITLPTGIALSSAVLLPHQQILRLDEIPPFGYKSVPFSFQKTPFLTNTKADFTIRIQDDTIQQEIAISPFALFYQLVSYQYSYVILAGFILIATVSAGGLFIFRRK